LFLLIKIFAISLVPIFLKVWKGIDKTFDLINLSKIYFMVFIYYLAWLLLPKYFNYDLYDRFLLSLFLQFTLASAFIIAVFKFSPINKAKTELFTFPTINKKSSLFIFILILFLYMSLIIYLATEFAIDAIPIQIDIMYAFINEPFTSIPMYLILCLYSVIGEELVIRYFTINAIRPFFKERDLPPNTARCLS